MQIMQLPNAPCRHIMATVSLAVLLLLCLTGPTDAYTKYGRTCKDIGCLPNEVCTMAMDACSYSQREGKECGSFPTCSRNSNGASGPSGASLGNTPENTVMSGGHHQVPLNLPQSPQRDHHGMNSGAHMYNVPPGPPIDTNSIFGNPIGQPAIPSWNSPPAFPNSQQSRGGSIIGGSSGQSNGGYPHVYPQIPQSQPMATYPYALPPPYNPPSQQQPYAFGNPPPQRNYATYYVTTTKEPSLWNQFLYNKQGGKKPSNGTVRTVSTSIGMLGILCVMMNSVFSRFVVRQ